jgi:hypothetical protein
MARSSITTAFGLPLSLVLFLLTTTAPVTAQTTAPVNLPIDRTILPMPESQYPHTIVLEARHAAAPKRFDGSR